MAELELTRRAPGEGEVEVRVRLTRDETAEIQKRADDLGVRFQTMAATLMRQSLIRGGA